MVWIAVLLAVICLWLMVYLLIVKAQLRSMRREIDRTAASDYDRLVTVSLIDKDLTELAAAINRSIDNQKKLKSDAEQAEVSLRQSVSDIAHDLRTPLSVIKGDLQLILREDISPRCREYAEICLEKAERLKEMSDEFFELAVLESDRSEIRTSRINLTNLLMKFIAENEGVIRLSGLSPEISLPPKTVFVMGEEQLILRMLGNLLGNVLKYSRSGFSLTLTEEGKVTISNPVEDKTIVPERLFDRAYRGDLARRGNGAGLGLYIVKLLAEKQGGGVAAAVENGRLMVTIAFKNGRS